MSICHFNLLNANAFVRDFKSASFFLQADKPEYFRIDPDKFLRHELAGKFVIEFPVLIVLLPDEVSKYNLTESQTASQSESPAAT